MPNTLISKAPRLGENRKKWLINTKLTCVNCGKSYDSREKLMEHYDDTRHDKYSAFKR